MRDDNRALPDDAAAGDHFLYIGDGRAAPALHCQRASHICIAVVSNIIDASPTRPWRYAALAAIANKHVNDGEFAAISASVSPTAQSGGDGWWLP